jgi:HEXXH motif-containing protein
VKLTDYELPAAVLDELATGGGDADTISALQQGQLRKHLLLLAALDKVSAATAQQERNRAGWGEAFQLLADVQAVNAGAVANVLLHPQVGAWLVDTLERLHQADLDRDRLAADLGHFAGIAGAAAIRAGHDFVLGTFAAGPTFTLPGLGRLQLSPGPVVIANRTGVTTISSGGSELELLVDSTDTEGWEPLRRLRADHDGLTLIVELDDVDPYRGHNFPSVGDRLTATEFDHWQRIVIQAWQLLVQDHRRYAVGIAAGLRSLVPQESVNPHRSISATSTDAFGCVALSRPTDPASLAVTLIHEFQHGKLSALLDDVPLYEDRTGARYCAPWRDDPRPLGGLLQGTYAFLGVTDFWRIHRHRAAGQDGAIGHFEFARWYEQTRRANGELAASRDLTDAGQAFVKAMGAVLDGWHGEFVPSDFARQARDSGTDHRARWRARNLTIDAVDLQRLSDAWLANASRPDQLIDSVLNLDAPPDAADPARLQLWHLKLTRPDVFEAVASDPSAATSIVSGTTQADIHYVLGNYSSASREYAAQVREVGAPVAWVGLALSLLNLDRTSEAAAILEAPELLFPLYSRLLQIGRTPDPVDVASWLTLVPEGTAS